MVAPIVAPRPKPTCLSALPAVRAQPMQWKLIATEGLGGCHGRTARPWCRVWCKTQCNNHAIPLQQNGSQPYVLLHGMQGVSGSNPLGSISKPRLALGFLMFGQSHWLYRVGFRRRIGLRMGLPVQICRKPTELSPASPLTPPEGSTCAAD